MADFSKQLDEYMKNIKKLVPNTETRSKMTRAGAEVYKDKLTKITKEKHYSSHKDEIYGHMADNISVNDTDIDGEHNGRSVVGWNNPFHAANARRLNDGTKYYPADHFVDNARRQSTEDVFKAEREVYEKYIKGDV